MAQGNCSEWQPCPRSGTNAKLTGASIRAGRTGPSSPPGPIDICHYHCPQQGEFRVEVSSK